MAHAAAGNFDQHFARPGTLVAGLARHGLAWFLDDPRRDVHWYLLVA
jgi:hypothetical protein